MLRRILIFIAAFALAAPSVTAFAKPEREETQRERERRLAKEKNATLVFWDYVACAVRRNPERSRTFLETLQWHRGISRRARDFAAANGSCLLPGQELSFKEELFRGAMAAALVRRDFLDQGIALASEAPVIFSEQNVPSRDSDDWRIMYITLGFAECSVRSAAGDVLAYVRADIYSPEEKDLVARLQPVLSACLPVKDGMNLSFSRVVLKSYLAQALYEMKLRGHVRPMPLSGL